MIQHNSTKFASHNGWIERRRKMVDSAGTVWPWRIDEQVKEQVQGVLNNLKARKTKTWAKRYL